MLSGDPITKILFATAVPFAEIAVNLAFVAVTTRVLFALAFDRLLPVSVAKVNERNHAPTSPSASCWSSASRSASSPAYANLANIVALESLFFALILLAGGVAATFLALPPARPDRAPGATDVDRMAGSCARSRWSAAPTTVLALFTIVRAGRALQRLRQVQRRVDHSRW